MYNITYKHRESFVVHMHERDIAFERREKLYMADWYTKDTVVAATVQENEMLYSRDQVKRAKEAHEFLKNSGYPSLSEAVHLLNDGNVQGGPQLLHADVEQVYWIYRAHPEYIRGKMTRKTVGRVQVDPALRSVEKTLKVYADIMHIDTMKFLESVADPLHLTLQSQLESEAHTPLGMALQGQLALLGSRGFVPSIVYTDPHSTFRSMTQDFPGVEIDIGGAGDYVAKVDAKIRWIKETYRTIKCGLSWTLPQCLIAELVTYVVSQLNIRRTSALSKNVCPRVLFTGVSVNYKKELKVAFGDYVEAYEGTDNTSRARSAACIALYPANNAAGLWVLRKIDTRSKVRRTNFEKLVTTDLVKETLERIAEEQEHEAEQPVLLVAVEVEEESDATQQSTSKTDNGEKPDHDQIVERSEEMGQVDEVEERVAPEEERVKIVDEEPEGTGGQAQPIGVTRTGQSIIRPSRFLAVTKVAAAEWKNKATDKAIKAELSMLFDELHALRAVCCASIKAGTKILKSHMFVVEKYLAMGEYEKTKARLVADGRDQEADMYPNKSSPTVAIHSVFTILGMASSKPWWIVIKINIRSAFVQTLMSGEPVYMKLDPKITKYAVELCPELKKYRGRWMSVHSVIEGLVWLYTS